jgi:glycosyltransferase involved in cell wall biosynthesis
MNIRILFLIPETYPTFRVDVSILFGKYLPLHGIYSDLVAGKSQSYSEVAVWGGGDTYLCDISDGTAKKYINTFIHSVKYLIKADRVKYQAIQVRDMPFLATIAMLVSKLKGIPFFYWMSYPKPEGNILLAHHRRLSEGVIKYLFPLIRGYIGKFLLYRLILPKADHIFVQSDQMKKNLNKYGIGNEKMTSVPMGVDMEALQENKILPSDDLRLVGKRVLVYLGTLDGPRRVETLFEMLSIIKLQFPTVMLVMVGDDLDSEVQRKWLKIRASEIGINDHLIWAGWLPRLDAWRYVRSAEIGLSPIPRGYLLDCSSPTKLPEYLALGLPVICNDNPDQEQVIRQTSAGFCVKYTAEEFASSVIKMLSLDKNKRSKMIRNGKDYVSQYRDYYQISSTVAGSYKKVLLNNSDCQND